MVFISSLITKRKNTINTEFSKNDTSHNENTNTNSGETTWGSLEQEAAEMRAEIEANNKAVNSAIDATKEYLGSYFENTCKQRLEGGLGSSYDGINSAEEMENALRSANWIVAEHPDVMPGCTAYTTKDIKSGHFGLLKIADLPDDATITASDPKGTGKVSMVVSGEKGPEVEDTWLITGDEDGHDVVFTFHPGEPVRPSLVEVENCPDGKQLTKEEAIALGFDLAKIG